MGKLARRRREATTIESRPECRVTRFECTLFKTIFNAEEVPIGNWNKSRTTGLTIPEAGQISPELEDTRQKLQTGT
ncbi:MAG: hypothetical protein PHC94_07620 [Methylobacter sp.]|nr:hypothetical protein [Methylococcales bacterium]MDD5113870.1 hypothetical protein [Methylobacter sp.]